MGQEIIERKKGHAMGGASLNPPLASTWEYRLQNSMPMSHSKVCWSFSPRYGSVTPPRGTFARGRWFVFIRKIGVQDVFFAELLVSGPRTSGASPEETGDAVDCLSVTIRLYRFGIPRISPLIENAASAKGLREHHFVSRVLLFGTYRT